MKRQADKGRKESKEWKKRDRVMLSTKDLVFKERLMKKLNRMLEIETKLSTAFYPQTDGQTE